MNSMKCLTAIFAGLFLVADTGTANAQSYPEREVRLLVNYGAGGSVDRMGRLMQRYLPDALGQSVIVENVAGAGGKVGLQKFMQTDADCYTVLTAFAPATTYVKHTNPDMFSMDDLAVINVQWIDPAILIARKDTGWKNLGDMIKAVRENPGEYALASSGKGSVGPVLARELFKALELDVKMVPYRGGGNSRKAFAGGETQMTAAGSQGALRVKDISVPLAAFWDGDVPGWPDAQSVNEQLKSEGTTIPTGGAYRFFAVKAECKENHPERFETLVSAFETTTKSEAFKEAGKETGVDTDWLGPEKAQETIVEADQRFSDIFKGS